MLLSVSVGQVHHVVQVHLFVQWDRFVLVFFLSFFFFSLALMGLTNRASGIVRSGHQSCWNFNSARLRRSF